MNTNINGLLARFFCIELIKLNENQNFKLIKFKHSFNKHIHKFK